MPKSKRPRKAYKRVVILTKTEPLALAEVMAGIEAITGVKDRGDETGKWGLSGDQFRAISSALVLADDLQDVATRREVRDAIVKVYDSAVDVKKEMRAAA